MGGALTGCKLAVLGGDERQVFLVKSLLMQGAKIKVFGFPGIKDLAGSHFSDNLEETISDVEAIILPLNGTDLEGNINNLKGIKLRLTEDVIRIIATGLPIFTGIAKPFLKSWANKYNLKIIEIAELDEFAILNSIPTAEGAIQIAMQQSPVTIHGSKSVVLGFGRCGQTLARMLAALGAHTLVVARKPADLARIKEMGLKYARYTEIKSVVTHADLVFNTVPANILNADVLSHLNKEAIIIDIASAPGGIDYAYAQMEGIKATLATGLPGKVAPKTAGLILGEVLPKYILKEISLSQNTEAGGNEI